MKRALSGPKVALYLSWLVAGIMVLLPFHAFFTSWAGNNFGHLDLFRVWKEIILVLASPFILWLGWRNLRTRDFLKHSWIVRLFIVYVLLHLVIGAWAWHDHNVNKTALIYALIVNLRFIGFFIVTYIVATAHPFLKKFTPRIIIAPAILVIIVGLIQKLTLPHDFLWYFYGRGTIPADQTVDTNNSLRRVQSTLRGPNPLGAYLVLVFSAFIVLIKNRYVKMLSLAAALVVLFESYSRSAWIGVFIALWLLAWWSLLKRHHRTWLVVSIIVVLATVGGALYFLRSKPIAQDTLLHTSSLSKSAMSSNEARRTALKNGLHDVIHEPLGRGPGTAGPASFRNEPHGARIAENYFLQIGQEVGILGVGLFIAINALVARELWARRDSLLAHVLLASLAGITVINLLSHAWADDTLSYLWWGLAGICLAPILTAKSKDKLNAKQKT